MNWLYLQSLFQALQGDISAVCLKMGQKSDSAENSRISIIYSRWILSLKEHTNIIHHHQVLALILALHSFKNKQTKTV